MQGQKMKKRILSMMLIGIPAFTAFAEETAGNIAEDGDGIIETGEDKTAELARATQNPVSNLISVPFQWPPSRRDGQFEKMQVKRQEIFNVSNKFGACAVVTCGLACSCTC